MESLLTFFESWPRVLGGLGGLIVVAFVAKWAASRLLAGVVRTLAGRTRTTWDDRLVDRGVVLRLARAVPALVVYAGLGPALGVTSAQVEALAADGSAALLFWTWTVVRTAAAAYAVVVVARTFSAALEAANDIYNDTYADAKSAPIKGYLQVASLLGYLAAAVVIASMVAGVSPLVLLSGLGALAAVLMLVFKDTILSLVASVQIMSNDMVRIGDWVEMPQAGADGDVIDVALHTVKIQNWDKTISTIPTYKFISESFRNWRGMSDAGGRRIKRALRIDQNSVRFLTDNEIEALSQRDLLRAYMKEKRDDIARHNAARTDDAEPDSAPEVRRLTNLGTFRAYVHRYLSAHPKTHQDMTLIVRQLAPGPQGVPIEVYCFSSDTAWASYEAFQADIFDHLIAVLPEFGLKVFQEPAGADFAGAMTDEATPK